MLHKWVRPVLCLFALIVALEVGAAAQTTQVDSGNDRQSQRVTIYEDQAGFVYANPFTIHAIGNGKGKIIFRSDTIDFVVTFPDSRICGQKSLQGSRGQDITCNVPKRCVKGRKGYLRDSCGYHFYTIRKPGAFRATESDPEIVIDEGSW